MAILEILLEKLLLFLFEAASRRVPYHARFAWRPKAEERRGRKRRRERGIRAGIFAASRVVPRGRPCSWQLARVYFREWRILLPPQHFCASFYQLKSTLSEDLILSWKATWKSLSQNRENSLYCNSSFSSNIALGATEFTRARIEKRRPTRDISRN